MSDSAPDYDVSDVAANDEQVRLKRGRMQRLLRWIDASHLSRADGRGGRRAVEIGASRLESPMGRVRQILSWPFSMITFSSSITVVPGSDTK
jgi:hypothetical protein